MDPRVADYVAAIDPERRPLFDRVHHAVIAAYPDAEVVFSYKMPTYVVGTRRLYVGVWKHGVSLYGWGRDRDGGLAARHPEWDSGKGTLRLPAPGDAVTDDELDAFARAVLAP